MKQRLLILLAVVAAVAALFLLWRQYTGGYYQGKSVAVWAPQAATGDPKAVAAIQAMGSDAVPGLVRLLQARNSPFRQKLWTFERRLPRWVSRFIPGSSVPPTLAVTVREQSAHCLGLLGPRARRAIPALARALRDLEGRVCWEAAAALARIGPDAVPVLTQALDDPRTSARHAAVYALGEIGPPALAAIPAVVRTLADTNEQVRASAVYSLSIIGTPGLAELADVVQRGPAQAKEAAARQLLNLQRSLRTNGPALAKMAHDTSPGTRRQALETLAALHIINNPAMNAFTNALTDPVAEVRLAAVKALGQAGWRAPAAVPPLVQALADASPAVREVAARTLGSLQLSTKSAIPQLIRLSREDPEPAVRSAAREALTKIDPDALH